MVLSAIGGGLGVLLGLFLIGLVKSFSPPTELPLQLDIGMDAAVLTGTFLVTVVTGLVFGLAPALLAARQQLVDSLKDGAPGAGGRSGRLRQGLVVGQVALCLVLLIAAGMVLRSLQEIRQIDLGFNPEYMVTASVDPALQGHPVEDLDGFFTQLREDLLSRPGVEAVGFAATVPLTLSSSQSSVLPEGYEVPEGQDWPSLDINTVDHGYFEAMGIPIARGRAFEASDDADGAPVVMINEAFAERFWPGENAVGKRVQARGADREVIGVVPTGRYFSIGEDPKPFYYLPRAQVYRGQGTFIHVRTASDPVAYLSVVREAVAALDSTLPVSDLSTMRGTLGLAYLPARMAAGVVGSFAVLALLLAAVGLYGVISFSVSQGTRDIGLRMALGARAANVVQTVVQHGMKLVGLGLGLGLIGGFLLTRAASSVLFGVSATDPLAYVVATAVLLTTALAASLLPARRATRIDPLIALRND